MVWTLFVQLCLKTVSSAHYQAFLYIYFGQKYKNEDDNIIMTMQIVNPIDTHIFYVMCTF